MIAAVDTTEQLLRELADWERKYDHTSGDTYQVKMQREEGGREVNVGPAVASLDDVAATIRSINNTASLHRLLQEGALAS